jgi:hypothetical protein
MDKMHTLVKGKPQKSTMLPPAAEKNKLTAHYTQTSKCLRCGTDTETVADNGLDMTFALNGLKLPI